MKNKYYKKGREAAKRGEGRHENPYTLTPEMVTLLTKRNQWERGWEDRAYVPSHKQLKKEAKAKREQLHHIEKRVKKHKHKHRHHHD